MNPGLLPVAGMDGDTIAAITEPLCIFAIPIVAILTRHQQKMASLIHAQPQQSNSNEAQDQMRQDIMRLTQAVSALTLTVDNLKDRIEYNDRVSQRVQAND